MLRSVTVPIADGGEGTMEALVPATRGKFIEKEVIGRLELRINKQLHFFLMMFC
jgi:glycerate kinase